MARVLFVLSPPRSFTSVVAACIGQHRDVVAVPELNLLVTDTVAEWLQIHEGGRNPGAHGLLRAVAELYFGEQTEETVRRALSWVMERAAFDTGVVFQELADKVAPAWLLDKSHRITVNPAILQRLLSRFPDARFLHLLRHPLTAGQSMAPVSPFDPQRVWFTLHCHIIDFLSPLPEAQKMQMRGEDLLADPVTGLRGIARWLGLDSSEEAVDAMLHPERSPFAHLGPANARYGNAYSFLADPRLRPTKMRLPDLDESLPWRDDGARLLPDVKAMAIEFGYG
jgi:hypothetical protein